MFLNTFLQVLCLFHVWPSVASTVIKTSTGPLKGKLNFYGRTKYRSFEGIPFAEPPIGDLRFRPPVPIRPWTHLLDATSPGSVCPQPEYFYQRYEMDENCLFLNIYVPVIESANLLPVIFFVHGGLFSFGSGRPKPTYGPELMLGKGLIVVTTNYRLGALGFLSLGTIDVAGNAGLKDIILALKWVNKNIIKFGGNPNSTCLIGQGAGAALVHYLLLTDQTTSLFTSAGIIAGSAINYRARQLYPKENALNLAQKLGIKGTNWRYLVNKLKEVDAFSVIDAQEYIVRNDPRKAFVLRYLFSPVIEEPSPIALFTTDPLDIIRTESLIQKVPIITGFNNQEGLEIFSVIKEEPEAVDKLNENFELCIPPDIQYPLGSEEGKKLANAIRKFYFNGGNITIFNTQNYINLISDTAYTYSADYWINIYKNQKCSSAVYYYFLQIDGELNWGKLSLGITYPGACHADELGYWFRTNVTEARLRNLDSNGQAAIDGILYFLKNFTVYGNPVFFGGFQWPEAGSNRAHIVLGDTQTIVNQPPLQDRVGFWRKEYKKFDKFKRGIKV